MENVGVKGNRQYDQVLRPFGWSGRQAIFFLNRRAQSENRAKPMAVRITRCCQKSARLAPRRITARASSIKYVVGSSAPTAQKIHGIVSRGKMKPEKNTEGMMNTIVICSAWIWFCARVETSR